MKTLNLIRAIMLVISFTITLCGQAIGADNSWLVGKWELTHDPDGSEKDWMEFTSDGKVYSINASGRRVPGEYSVSGIDVNITYSFNGKTIPIHLTHSNDNKKLFAYSSRTGNTAEYQKLK